MRLPWSTGRRGRCPTAAGSSFSAPSVSGAGRSSDTGVHEHTVGKWRMRFAEIRVESLWNEYRSGRPRNVTDDKVEEVAEWTLTTMPKNEKPRPCKRV